jgi:tetratricopeptide (TPR) repeat protein
MTSKDYVEKNLDWDSAIAEATLELEGKSISPLQNPNESYLYRGIARCFISDKDGAYKEAIEDLSQAIALGLNEAYYYRAYAYFLAGNYERAIADCDKIINVSLKHEFLAKIFMSRNKYSEVIEKFKEATSLRTLTGKIRLLPPIYCTITTKPANR